MVISQVIFFQIPGVQMFEIAFNTHSYVGPTQDYLFQKTTNVITSDLSLWDTFPSTIMGVLHL